MTKRTTLQRAALGALLMALCGCGYALVGRGANIPADVRSVYLQPLANRTQRTQVEQALTRAIAEELVTRQRFAVVGSESEANAEILGAVKKVENVYDAFRVVPR